MSHLKIYAIEGNLDNLLLINTDWTSEDGYCEAPPCAHKFRYKIVSGNTGFIPEFEGVDIYYYVENGAYYVGRLDEETVIIPISEFKAKYVMDAPEVSEKCKGPEYMPYYNEIIDSAREIIADRFKGQGI